MELLYYNTHSHHRNFKFSFDVRLFNMKMLKKILKNVLQQDIKTHIILYIVIK